MKRFWLSFALFKSLVALCALLGAATAQAYEIQTLATDKLDQPRISAAKAIGGTVVITNLTRQVLVLKPLTYRNGGALFAFKTEREVLKPGESRALAFTGQIAKAGKYEIDLPLEVRNEREALVDTYRVELFYLVQLDKRRRTLTARVSDYEELFLRLGATEVPGMGRVFQARPDTGDLPRGKEYRENRQPPMARWALKPDRRLSLRIPSDTVGEGGRRELQMEERELKTQEETGQDADAAQAMSREGAAGSRGIVNATGVQSWMGTDGVLHPAWGWRARAWLRVGSGGTWNKVAEDWVEWDGRWRLSFNQPAGTQVQFQFIAYNRYYTPQTNDGDTYRWVNPVRTGALAANHDEGAWWADTNTGNGRGLGELYQDAMELWSNLYWQGNINPLRSESIKVIFPNLTYKCGGTKVWSCANTDGNIWLIPSAATNRETIIHELGHQLNYEYWDNSRPDNSGGSHSLDQCYTAGLALLEGFGNYMVGWVKTNRDTNASMKRSLEDPSAIGACTTTNLNEGYVGATFWDLHDKVADGDDNLWFNYRGAVAALYLNAGMKQKMSDFRETYRNAANPEHRSIIDKIFEMNHTK